MTQVVERGYSVKEVSERIGVSTHSLFKRVNSDPRDPKAKKKEQNKNAQGKEIQRLQEERDFIGEKIITENYN